MMCRMVAPFLLPFIALGLALLSLWVTRGPVIWNSLLAVALVLAWMFQVIDGRALLLSLLTGGVIYGYFRRESPSRQRRLLGGLMTLLILGLFGHFFPGFQDVTLLDRQILSRHAYPTSILWSFDKPLAGLLLVGWGFNRARRRDWKSLLPPALLLSTVCVALMMAGAYALHAIEWAPKWGRAAALFAFGNLLFVCIPEEAFFRGLVQGWLMEAMRRYPRGRVVAVLLSALFFGLCHIAGGLGLMEVATVAGVFYAAAIARTQRLEAAIVVHFLLNLTHFALFTYPALRP
jgi:uncharacterized protein